MGKLEGYRICVGKKIILTISWLAFFCLCIKSDILFLLTGSESIDAVGVCTIIVAAVLLVCIWAIPDFRFAGKKDGRYIFSGLLFNLIAGFCFFYEWITCWDVQTAAATLGFDAKILLFIPTVLGVVVAIPFTASLIKSFLSRALNKQTCANFRKDIFGDKIIFVIGLLIGAVGVCSLIVISFSPDIWADEAFSLNIIKNNYVEMIQATAEDVHPPLYYIILKFFVDGFHRFLPDVSSICLAKLVSIIPFGLVFLLCITRIRKNWGLYVGGAAASAMAGMPLLIEYGIEIRMYSWAMLFVTASLLFAYDIICRRKIRSWIGLVIFSLFAAYTHYFALVAVAVIYLCLLIRYLIKERRNLIKWIVSAVVAIFGYIPWLFVLLKQVQDISGDYWISEITSYTIYSYISDVFGISFYMLPVLIALVVSASLLIRRNGNENIFICVIAILIPIVTTLIGIAASFLIRPVFVVKYAIPGLFCLWLGGLIAVNLLFNSKFRKILALIIFLTAAVNIGYFASEQYYYWNECERTIAFLESNEDAVYISDSDHMIQTVGCWTDCIVYFWDYEYVQNIDLLQEIYSGLQYNITNTDELLDIVESYDQVYFAEYEDGIIDELTADGSIEASEIGDYRAEEMVTIYLLILE